MDRHSCWMQTEARFIFCAAVRRRRPSFTIDSVSRHTCSARFRLSADSASRSRMRSPTCICFLPKPLFGERKSVHFVAGRRQNRSFWGTSCQSDPAARDHVPAYGKRRGRLCYALVSRSTTPFRIFDLAGGLLKQRFDGIRHAHSSSWGGSVRVAHDLWERACLSAVSARRLADDRPAYACNGQRFHWQISS